MTTLIITEKNKASEAIAKAIGPVKVIEKTKKLNFWLVYKSPEETLKLWENSMIHLKEGVQALKEEAEAFK